MTDMQSFLSDLLAETPEGRRELVRAQLRVAVAEALLLRMEAKNMNKAQLAQLLGVTRSAVSQALTGSRNMSLNLLADMATALGLRAHVVLQAIAPATQAATAPAAAYRQVVDVRVASCIVQGHALRSTTAGQPSWRDLTALASAAG